MRPIPQGGDLSPAGDAPLVSAGAETLAHPVDATVDPNTFRLDDTDVNVPSDARPTSTLHRRVSSLPPDAHGLPTVSIGKSSGHALIEGAQLGAGGMGVVHVAHDTVLERIVAVKRPLGTAGDKAATALIAEARTLAGLDHPNVVPVHALGCDTDGAPLLVMKRVVGRPWTQLIADGRDLDRDLGILLRVCDALRFAHARGVLHRDVKPDNVMVGDFGEVYLMDWGCACALDGAVSRELVGTPTCMAPEMITIGATIGPPTDVFLLGATLHQALTLQPRHPGRTVREVLGAALRSAPASWPPEVPPALAAIVDRACAKRYEDRHPTVEALAEDLRGFLRHRAASTLAAKATALLGPLADAVARSSPEADALFAECRFGFRGALEGWPACPEAQTGLDRAHEVYIPWKIGAGELGVVESLLPDVPSAASARWGAELAAARVGQSKAKANLASIDLGVAASERRSMAVGVVVTGTVTAIGANFMRPPSSQGNLDHLVLGAFLLVMLVGWMVPFRGRLFAHRASRALSFGMIACTVMVVLNRVVCTLTDTPVATTLRTDCLLFAIGVIIPAMTWEKTLALAAVPYLLGAVGMALRPDLANYLFPFAIVAGGSVVAAVFARMVVRRA